MEMQSCIRPTIDMFQSRIKSSETPTQTHTQTGERTMHESWLQGLHCLTVRTSELTRTRTLIQMHCNFALCVAMDHVTFAHRTCTLSLKSCYDFRDDTIQATNIKVEKVVYNIFREH